MANAVDTCVQCKYLDKQSCHCFLTLVVTDYIFIFPSQQYFLWEARTVAQAAFVHSLSCNCLY